MSALVNPEPDWITRLLIAVTCIYLSACATQSSKIDSHNNAVADIEQWHIRGKIGIRSPTESLSAMLNWQQLTGAYTIRLSGTLGSGSLQIIGNDNGVTVRQAGEIDQYASNAGLLLQRRLGWSVPIEHVYYWVRGLPAAVPVDRQTNSDGQLSVLEQAGWRIEYLRYQQFANFALPSKLRLQHEDLKVTLIIKEWQLKKPT
ncbi:MAG: lipoprotein insertase outer membrane protein LolB [Pseudomonadales bacterium]